MSAPADLRTARWLAEAAGGRLDGEPTAVLAGTVTTDTRELRAGDLFVALPGASTDGARFAGEAVARGAFGVVGTPEAVAAVRGRAVTVSVPDPLEALRGIARAWRSALDCETVAVTGSVGKTTTKDLVAALLRPSRPVHATVDSFNTFQGVPATIAAAPPATETLVVEIAMRARGDIAGKAALAAPTAGIITGVSASHLDTSGTIEAVARHKAELIAALPPGAPCVVPAGEPLLAPYLRDDLRTIAHGPRGDVSLRAFDGRIAEIDCHGELVRVVPGFAQAHDLANLVAAVALVHALGVTPTGPLPDARSPYRWQRDKLDGGADVIADCFNSMPHGLDAALVAFAAEPAGRRVAVLGPMHHLGERSRGYHRAAGERAAALGIDVLITVGDGAEAFAPGFAGPHHHVATPAAARSLAEALTGPGDRVLVKGAHAHRLWEFLG